MSESQSKRTASREAVFGRTPLSGSHDGPQELFNLDAVVTGHRGSLSFTPWAGEVPYSAINADALLKARTELIDEWIKVYGDVHSRGGIKVDFVVTSIEQVTEEVPAS